MHKSLIERVHFYLDENEYISSESYFLRGWVFSETAKIEEITKPEFLSLNNGTPRD